MRTRLSPLLAALALIAVLIAAPVASAQPGRPTRPGEETAGNNLSVPAIFVPGMTGAPAVRVACPSEEKAPGWDGVPPSTLYPGYWLQKTAATWTADCLTATSASVIADWGDNLTTSPRLAAGRPVRVEVGLLAATAVGMTGYTVTKLTPDLEDRLATYGTNGASFVTGAAGAPAARVWDAGARLTIVRLENGVPAATIYDGPMTAEINSIGAVVYGYNWGSQGRGNAISAGTYRLTFTLSPSTTITGVADSGVINNPTFTPNSTSLVVTLLPSNRGGGGGSGGGPGNGGPGNGGR